MHRIYLAFQVFFRVLFGRPLPPELLPPPEARELPPARPEQAPAREAKPAPAPALKMASVDPGALLLLSLLQREGRLLDFLKESIEAYDDATVGAAVRDIHRGCKKVLEEHFRLEPVVAGSENEAYKVDAGFDPCEIRLVGNVAGQPPFDGTLRHHGWRATEIKLPRLADGMDPSVVAPAEVELA